MNRAQALSKLNRSDMRNAAAERGMQRLFTWNRAHWIGMVVLIAVLLLLQWSSSMYLMPDEVLDRAAKNLFVWFPGMVLHWPLVLGITNLILGSTRSGSLSFPLASAIIGPLAFGWTNLRLRPGFPYPHLPFTAGPHRAGIKNVREHLLSNLPGDRAWRYDKAQYPSLQNRRNQER